MDQDIGSFAFDEVDDQGRGQLSDHLGFLADGGEFQVVGRPDSVEADDPDGSVVLADRPDRSGGDVVAVAEDAVMRSQGDDLFRCPIPVFFRQEGAEDGDRGDSVL